MLIPLVDPPGGFDLHVVVVLEQYLQLDDPEELERAHTKARAVLRAASTMEQELWDALPDRDPETLARLRQAEDDLRNNL